MNKADQSINSAFLESVKYVDALAQILVPVDMAASQGNNRQAIKLPSFSNFLEATEQEISALKIAENQQKTALIQELQAQNSNLLKRIHHLEQELTQSRNAIKEQQAQSETTKNLLTQKTQELADAQAQINQHQQQAQHIAQTESTCQELRTRLNRQQCHTLQLKIALEKCLDSGVNRVQPDDEQSVYPQQPSIKPWSEEHFTTPTNTGVNPVSPQFTQVEPVSCDLPPPNAVAAADAHAIANLPEAELLQDLTDLLAAVETPANDAPEVEIEMRALAPTAELQPPVDANLASPVTASQPTTKRNLTAIELPHFVSKSSRRDNL